MGNTASHEVGHDSSPGTAARNRIFGIASDDDGGGGGGHFLGDGDGGGLSASFGGCMPANSEEDLPRFDLLATPRCGGSCCAKEAQAHMSVQEGAGPFIGRRGVVLGGGKGGTLAPLPNGPWLCQTCEAQGHFHTEPPTQQKCSVCSQSRVRVLQTSRAAQSVGLDHLGSERPSLQYATNSRPPPYPPDVSVQRGHRGQASGPTYGERETLGARAMQEEINRLRAKQVRTANLHNFQTVLQKRWALCGWERHRA